MRCARRVRSDAEYATSPWHCDRARAAHRPSSERGARLRRDRHDCQRTVTCLLLEHCGKRLLGLLEPQLVARPLAGAVATAPPPRARMWVNRGLTSRPHAMHCDSHPTCEPGYGTFGSSPRERINPAASSAVGTLHTCSGKGDRVLPQPHTEVPPDGRSQLLDTARPAICQERAQGASSQRRACMRRLRLPKTLRAPHTPVLVPRACY